MIAGYIEIQFVNNEASDVLITGTILHSFPFRHVSHNTNLKDDFQISMKPVTL